MFWIYVAGGICAFAFLIAVPMITGEAAVNKGADGEDLSPEALAAAKKTAKAAGVFVLLVAIAGTVGVYNWYRAHTSEESVAAREAERSARAASNRRDQCESTTGANLMAREFVRDRLIAPTKAKFAPYRDSSVAPTGGKCEFTVSSYVDGQNAFGATVRTRYFAVVKYNPDTDRWTLVQLDM